MNFIIPHLLYRSNMGNTVRPSHREKWSRDTRLRRENRLSEVEQRAERPLDGPGVRADGGEVTVEDRIERARAAGRMEGRQAATQGVVQVSAGGDTVGFSKWEAAALGGGLLVGGAVLASVMLG